MRLIPLMGVPGEDDLPKDSQNCRQPGKSDTGMHLSCVSTIPHTLGKVRHVQTDRLWLIGTVIVLNISEHETKLYTFLSIVHPSIGTILCTERRCCRSSFLGYWAQSWTGRHSDAGYSNDSIIPSKLLLILPTSEGWQAESTPW